MASRKRETLYILDLSSLVFQVFHALPTMTAPDGRPTSAVFGFTKDLQNLLQKKQPDYLICAVDSSGPGERNDLYADYKANRTEMPEELEAQWPLIDEVLDAYHVPRVEYPRWEADDVIATLARQAAERGMEVAIVTSDKDVRQVIGPHVRLYSVRKDAFLDEEYLKEDWGIRPDQVPDFQALVGDSVDNVPGVPLVGPKKARGLLEQFGTLEDVLEHADEAPGKKLRENLKEYAEQARTSRQLVTLNTELPLEIDWEAARVREPDNDKLLELFTEWGFGRFAKEVGAAAQTDGRNRERVWKIVDTDEKFGEFLKELRQQRRFCLDLETTGLNPLRADIVGWAFSWRADTAWYVPVHGPETDSTLEHETVLEALRPLLEDPDVEIANQNIKYDMLVLRRAGVELRGVGVDPMVGDYLLDAGARSHSLDKLAEKYLQHRMIPISDLIGRGKEQKQMFEVDVGKVAEYAAEDADITWQIAERVAEELKRENLWELYWNLERPLIPVLVEMEFNGVRLDVEELKRQSRGLGRQLEKLVAEIHEIAGREFNIDSPVQLRTILFDELNLPVMKRTKTGPSTNQEVLEKLAPLHPLPAKITAHRRLSKLKGTYLDALPELVNPETGRIHASFNQVVAATGRLSSSEPNLQNIPIRTEEGRRIRKAFVASEPGWYLLCADYSQVELRMLAHFSGDPALAEAFRENADIHTAVAADIFGISPEDVDSERRRVAKAVNFGIVYGQSPFGLAATVGISQDEAAAFIDSYFERYSGVDRFLQELLHQCAETGYATTLMGRRRAISGIRNVEGRNRNLPERTTINTVIQGSAADLIKQAMLNVHGRLQQERHPGRMLLQIHDELVFEVPEQETASLAELVREEMQSALELEVPLVVDVSVGENWLEVDPLSGGR